MGAAPAGRTRSTACSTWRRRAPVPGARALAFHVLEEPLAEILGGRGALVELWATVPTGLGARGHDAAGGQRRSWNPSSISTRVSAMMPPITGAARPPGQLARRPALHQGAHLDRRRVLDELTGPRAAPTDPEDEIALLRAAMA